VKLTVCSPMSPQTFATRRFMKLEFSICGFSYVFLHSLTPPNIQNMTRLVKFVDPIIVTRVSDTVVKVFLSTPGFRIGTNLYCKHYHFWLFWVPLAHILKPQRWHLAWACGLKTPFSMPNLIFLNRLRRYTPLVQIYIKNYLFWRFSRL